MELLVIRHGQSEADILNVIEGRADFSLTDLGNRQAELMADWAANYMGIDKIISSSLKRAKQTAEKLAAATNAPIEYDDCLMEWKNGLIAGLSQKEADEKYPIPTHKFPHTAVYEQESDIEFRARAEIAFSRVINEHQVDSKIAIISHGGMINKLFQSFLGLSVNVNVGMYSGDTAVHHWKVSGSKRVIVFTNSLEHLENLR